MIYSMTGFAAKTITVTNRQGESSQVVITLKTVNARFFEATCRIPYQLGQLEPLAIKDLQKKLYRGNAYLNIAVTNNALFHGGVQPNLSIAKTYIEALRIIQKEHNIPGQIAISDLIVIKDLFSVQDLISTEDQTIVQPIITAISQVVEQLLEARKNEGAALRIDLQNRIAILHKEIITIEEKSAKILHEKTEKNNKKIVELEGDSSEAAQIKKHQLCSELERIDIHEEIIRFKSHLEQFSTLLENDNPEKGRRIDFILQELSREINTIAAKCLDASISSHAITGKVELEKAREQAQNIV